MTYRSLKSTKNIAVYVITILIISMVLAGCGDRFKNLSPKEAVIKANEKLKNVTGYRMKIDAELIIKDIKQQVTLTGEVRNPDQVHLTGDLAGMEIEIYQKGDKFFIKNPLTGKWVETKEMGLGDMNDIISTPEKTLNDLKDMISEAEYLPDEKVSGVDCKVIEYIPDQEKLKKIVFEGNEPGSIKDIKAKYRIWIGKKDFLIYKMNVDLKFDTDETGEQFINMTVLLYDFNNDININYPKDLAS
ncbi:DUF6612 family protein [Thermosediminibacter litoriperuensis]|uniref:LppX_LprAFG lipoprotein n=1 Tax=Thermosediminibacter litoriperuensis TaxID=291989 RepID=A0A5S5AYR4_9FIRM|nr:hypothetical protein LZ11_00007 [Thermosediminibacter litoriperuensis]